MNDLSSDPDLRTLSNEPLAQPTEKPFFHMKGKLSSSPPAFTENPLSTQHQTHELPSFLCHSNGIIVLPPLADFIFEE